jgi:hypothetical protein
MAVYVAGEMYYKLDGQLMEIKRQLRQKDGYPFDPEKLSQALQACIEGRFNVIDIFDYFTPITDADVPTEHQATLAKYRKLAEEHGVSADVSLCYRVRTGFTLKRHAPRAGRCHDDLQYIQNWHFKDTPTKNCLVFWVPRLVEDSTPKTLDQQRQLLLELRQRLELPEHHLSDFGEVSLVAGLVLAHSKITGERIPLEDMSARTDTRHADGRVLCLCPFGEGGLYCGLWYWSAGCYNIGVFALGVELGS